MRKEEPGREEGGALRLAASGPRDPLTEDQGDPLPAVQLLLFCKPLLPLTTAAVQPANRTSRLHAIGCWEPWRPPPIVRGACWDV